MNTYEFKANKFGTAGERNEQILAWQERYRILLGELGCLGTQVQVHRTLQDDKDTPPGHFIRHAAHNFIFPPQEVMLVSDDSKTIDHPINGYGLYRESRDYTYDDRLVKGHLRVNYNDSDGGIVLKVTDIVALGGQSELPEAAIAAIDGAFAWTTSAEGRVSNPAVENTN